MKDFRSLKVWELAHRQTLKVYEATASFPKDELYGLTSQLRRASSSVAANIAEGCGRRSDAELSRFSVIALGSASEMEYLLILSLDLGYLERSLYQTLHDQTIQVKRMLGGLIRKLNTGS